MTIDTKLGEEEARLNGHTYPIVKKGRGWGLRGTTKYDSKDEQEVWAKWIDYFKEKGIHDYNYLIKNETLANK